MIDTHAHLNFKAFKNDYADIINNSFQNNMKAIVNVGSNYNTSKKAIQIAKDFKNCYSAVALHPIHVKDEEFDKNKYIDLVKNNKEFVKAIGETGLDFYHNFNDVDLQKQLFLNHLDLVKQFNLPVILHSRGSKQNSQDAYEQILDIVNNLKFDLRGVIHCFSSNWNIAQKFLNLGFYIGFTGPITFKNADPELLKVVKNTPLDRILIETDCPFLAPEPHRGERNEPLYVCFIADKICKIKNIEFGKVIENTTKNAIDLFNLNI